MNKVLQLFILVIIVAIYIISTNETNFKSWKEKSKVGSGKITGFDFGGRGSGGQYYINYSYEINGKQFNKFDSYSNIDLHNMYMKYFIGKSFPIAYDSCNPKNSILLLLPKDYSLVNMNYPDSLSWILKLPQH